ncbi:MAG TPA: S41 family peptidase [Sphingobacterium sp.]|nr:S41 family peptidase [Sphingobacterium sp.]
MQKNVRRNILIAASYAAVLLLGIIFGQNYADQDQPVPKSTLVPIGFSAHSYKTQQLLDLLSSSYVDSVNIDSIQNEMIKHALAHLDPYSKYWQPSEVKARTEVLEGTFEGIGMEYFNLNDTLLVIGLINNGPADLAGFKVGDKILRIDDTHVSGTQISKEEIEDLIRGKRGTDVDVQIKRKDIADSFTIRVKRDQVKVSSIDASYMYDSTVAYLRLRRFALNSVKEFKEAITELKKEGAEKLILDLRDNGGGYFHVAVELASEFFERDTLIVYTEGANEARREYYSDREGILKDEDLVILINENTASASEIVTGAIQDWERGTIVGRRSYGKGTVQEQFSFSDGSSVNLSVAKYYTPLGRSIQKEYLPKKNTENKETDIWALDSVYARTQSYITIGGNELFSGGGIYPDIWVPRDSNAYMVFYQEVVNSHIIEQFLYDRFARESPAYSLKNFLKGYHLPSQEYDAFVEFATERGYVFDAQKKRDLKDLIQTDMEALVGRFYFGRSAYFKVKNREDDYLKAAMKVLNPHELQNTEAENSQD